MRGWTVLATVGVTHRPGRVLTLFLREELVDRLLLVFLGGVLLILGIVPLGQLLR